MMCNAEIQNGALRWLRSGCVALLALPLTGRAWDDLSVLSDEFDDAGSRSQWRRVFQEEGWGVDQLEQWDINTTRPGQMFLQPHASSWYQEWRGVQVYKPVSGDFVVTTDVTASRRGGGGPPTASYSLAGILVRAPRPGVTNAASWTPNGENYVFLSLGAANSPGTYQFEVKTTQDSDSQLEISAAPGGRARIQIARLGPYVIALRQFEGAAWEVHRRYSRTDLPATLNVGLTTYTDWEACGQVGYAFHNTNLLTNGLALPGGGTLSTHPDLDAASEYVRYQRPIVPADLAGRDFADPGQVSDGELLSFLGDEANRPGGAVLPARIVNPHYQPGVGFSLSLEVQTNRSYRVQVCESWPAPAWQAVTNFVSTTSPMMILDPVARERPVRFYRVSSP